MNEYRRLARHDILPALGAKRLDKLTARDIDAPYRWVMDGAVGHAP